MPRAVQNIGRLDDSVLVKDEWFKLQPQIEKMNTYYQQRWAHVKRETLWNALKADLESYDEPLSELRIKYRHSTKADIIQERVYQQALYGARQAWGDGRIEDMDTGVFGPRPRMEDRQDLSPNEYKESWATIRYNATIGAKENAYVEDEITGLIDLRTSFPIEQWKRPDARSRARITKLISDALFALEDEDYGQGPGGITYTLYIKHLSYDFLQMEGDDMVPNPDIERVSLFASDHPTTYRAVRGDRGVKNVCVIDTLLTHYRGQPGFSNLCRDDLKYLYEETTHSPEGECCLLDVYDWLGTRKLKYKFVDCTYRTIRSSSHTDHSNVKMLYAMIANNHMYLLRGAEALECVMPQLDLNKAIRMTKLDEIRALPANSVAVVKQDNLLDMIMELYKRHNEIASDINGAYTRMMTNGVHVVSRPDWDDCNAIVKALPANLADMCRTASIGGIASTLLQQAGIPESTMTDQVAELLSHAPILVHDTGASPNDGDLMCVDCVRSHPSILRDIDSTLVMDVSSTPEPFSGEISDDCYYIAQREWDQFMFMEIGLGKQLVARGSQMRDLIDMGVAELGDIEYQIHAYAKATVDFKRVFDAIDELDIPPSTAKHLRVAVCGSLRASCSKPRAFLSNSWKMLMCNNSYTPHQVSKGNTQVSYLGEDLYVVRCGESKRLINSKSPLHHDLIMGQMIKTLQLRKTLGGQLVQLKTDSVTVLGDRQALEQLEIREAYGCYRLETYKRQKLTSRPSTSLWTRKPWIDVGLEVVCERGGLVTALAGRGKSYSCLKQLAPEAGICIAYSHTVVQTMKAMYATHNGNPKTQFLTVAALLSMFNQNPSSFTRRLMGSSFLFIDEVFCISNDDMAKLYAIARQNYTRLIMAGDPNQLESCDDHPIRWYDTDALREMAKYRQCVLTELQRYDADLDNVCQLVLAGKSVPITFRPTSEAPQHLCWTHKRRVVINALEMQKHEGQTLRVSTPEPDTHPYDNRVLELQQVVDLARLGAIIRSPAWEADDEIGLAAREGRYAITPGTLHELKRLFLAAATGTYTQYTQTTETSRGLCGRYFARGGSVQRCKRVIRHTILRDLEVGGRVAYDLDMENCHVTLLHQWCTKNDVDASCLSAYINNKQDYRRRVASALVERALVKPDEDAVDVAKRQFLVMLNGGLALDGAADIPLLREFGSGIAHIHERVMELNPHLKVNGHNAGGRTCNRLMCALENQMWWAAADRLPKGVELLDNAFDGWVVLADRNTDINKLCRHVERSIAVTGYTVSVEHKPFDQGYEIDESDLLDASAIHQLALQLSRYMPVEGPCPPQDVRLYVGLPVYACVNDKRHGIHNRMSGSVTSVGEDACTIECGSDSFEVKHSNFHAVWRCGYAKTIHSSQGATLVGAVGFHEQDRWDQRMAYTMISRVKCLDNVCMDGPLTARPERQMDRSVPMYTDWRYMGVVGGVVVVDDKPSEHLPLMVEPDNVDRWTRILESRVAPDQKPVVAGGEHTVKLLGNILWEAARNRWVWRAMINGKKHQKVVGVTRKRSREQALEIIQQHQLKFSS